MHWSQNQSNQSHDEIESKSLTLDAKMSQFRSEIRTKQIQKERIKFMEKIKHFNKTQQKESSQISSQSSTLLNMYYDLETENFDCQLIFNHFDNLLAMLTTYGESSQENLLIINQCINKINLAIVKVYQMDKEFQINMSIRYRDIFKKLHIEGDHTIIINHAMEYLEILSYVGNFSEIEEEIFTVILQFFLSSQSQGEKDYIKCLKICNIFFAQLESNTEEQSMHEEYEEFNFQLVRQFIIKSSFQLLHCEDDIQSSCFIEIYSETLQKYIQLFEKIPTCLEYDQEPYLNLTIKDCLIQLIKSMAQNFSQNIVLNLNILRCLNFFISNYTEQQIKQMIEFSDLPNYLISCALFQDCQEVKNFSLEMIEIINKKFGIKINEDNVLELQHLIEKNL